MKHATSQSILVAGIGNIFLGDDGFGCEAVRELATMQLMPAAKVVDYGIRGIDLAYALLGPYKSVILVDAIARGGRAGTVYLLQPADPNRTSEESVAFDPHSMDPVHLIAMARSLGEITAEIFIVGCEPLDFGDELEGRMGLSEPIRLSIPEAVRTVVELIDRIHREEEHKKRLRYAVQ